MFFHFHCENFKAKEDRRVHFLSLPILLLKILYAGFPIKNVGNDKKRNEQENSPTKGGGKPAMTHNPYLIHPAMIVERKQESTDILTIRLRLTAPAHQEAFRFQAGQFNMLYVFGVGEVAISIVSDPDELDFPDHTIERNLPQLWKEISVERLDDTVTGPSCATGPVLWKDDSEMLLQEID